MKKEAVKSLEELQRMRHLKDEKEAAVESLQSELDTLKIQCKNLKHSLFEDELEKEKLRKQVVQLKDDLKKKEDAFTGMEKKLKESNGRAAVSDGTRTPLRNNKSAMVPRSPKEVASLREKIKLLEVNLHIQVLYRIKFLFDSICCKWFTSAFLLTAIWRFIIKQQFLS